MSDEKWGEVYAVQTARMLARSEAERSICVEDTIKMSHELEAERKEFPTCEQHKPSGGARSGCVVCNWMKLSAALARIDYAMDVENEQELSIYDVDCDEERVVRRVIELRKAHAEAASFAVTVDHTNSGLAADVEGLKEQLAAERKELEVAEAVVNHNSHQATLLLQRAEAAEAKLHEVQEIYAGMEGFEAKYASEAYLQRIIKQMYDAAMKETGK